MHEDDETIDAVNRVLALFDAGITTKVLRLALERSVDGGDFRRILGFIEDANFADLDDYSDVVEEPF